jgi:Cdc6-like AAA superfamily ATPase
MKIPTLRTVDESESPTEIINCNDDAMHLNEILKTFKDRYTKSKHLILIFDNMDKLNTIYAWVKELLKD